MARNIKRRILALVLALSAAASILSGCTLVEHNYERDNLQIVATVHPMTFDSWTTVDESGNETVHTYTSPKADIRKLELKEAVYNSGQSLAEQGASQAEIVESILGNLIDRKILVEAAKYHMKRGNTIVFNRNSDDPNFPPKVYYDIEDSITDMNTIWRGVYEIIDNQIFLIGNQMLKEQNEPERTKGENADVTPEFPLMPDFDARVQPEYEDDKEFDPSESNPPAKNDWIYLEATARLVRTLIERAEDRYLSNSEKNRLEADKKLLKEILKEEDGRHNLYLRLREFFVIEKFITQDQMDYQLIMRLQQYIVEDTKVSTDDVVAQYTTMLNEQRTLYSRDISAFEKALKDCETVLYHPTGGYYYVWQILIKFTDEQTAQLTQLRNSNLYTSSYVDNIRSSMAAGIMGRSHESGDFEGDPIPFAQIYSEIVTSVNNHTDSFYREREFLRLAYKYTQDPGMFGLRRGYFIKPGDTASYMTEFQKAAEKLVRENGIGAISEGVLTDYGIHILYYAKDIMSTTENGVGVYSFESPARINRIYDLIEEKVRSDRESINYSNFEQTIFSRFKNDDKTVEMFEKRYEDLLGK